MNRGKILLLISCVIVFVCCSSIIQSDKQIAFNACKIRAEKGDVDSQIQLAEMYRSANGVTVDYVKANEWCVIAAKNGNAHAQYTLGNQYIGSGDFENAFDWFSKAAQQGHADAQFELGWMYYYGQGVTQDYKKAFEWASKSAEQGNTEAQIRLVEMYSLAYGFAPDHEKAKQWYTRAAEKGNMDAQRKLGMLYAFERNSLDAEKGDLNAQSSLAEMYYSGEVVSKDYAKAFQMFANLAEHGVLSAYCPLAEMYYQGRGTTQDNIQAFKWISLCIYYFHPEISYEKELNLSNEIAAKMTPEQIEEAQRLASEFKPKVKGLEQLFN